MEKSHVVFAVAFMSMLGFTFVAIEGVSMDVPASICVAIAAGGLFMVILGILCAIDNQWIKRGHKSFAPSLFCGMFSWHNGDNKSDSFHDGCSVHSRCSRCGDAVMQDGQGNWF